MAEGAAKDLEIFIDWCKKGPLFGSVSRIVPIARPEYATPPVKTGEFLVIASV